MQVSTQLNTELSQYGQCIGNLSALVLTEADSSFFLKEWTNTDHKTKVRFMLSALCVTMYLPLPLSLPLSLLICQVFSTNLSNRPASGPCWKEGKGRHLSIVSMKSCWFELLHFILIKIFCAKSRFSTKTSFCFVYVRFSFDFFLRIGFCPLTR